MTRQEFLEKAGQIPVVINGQTYSPSPRQFSTDSVGWHVSDKMKVNKSMFGKTLELQIGSNKFHLNWKDKFSSGKPGWNYNGKITTPSGQAQIGCNLVIYKTEGDLATVQTGLNITIIGSKGWQQNVN